LLLGHRPCSMPWFWQHLAVWWCHSHTTPQAQLLSSLGQAMSRLDSGGKLGRSWVWSILWYGLASDWFGGKCLGII